MCVVCVCVVCTYMYILYIHMCVCGVCGVYICVYVVCVCVSVCGMVCAAFYLDCCMFKWRTEVNLGISPLDFQLIFLDKVSHLTWTSHVVLDSLASKFQGSNAPAWGGQARHSIWISPLLRIPTWVLRLAWWQVLCPNH